MHREAQLLISKQLPAKEKIVEQCFSLHYIPKCVE
jgi:hypothetical protein